MARPARTAARDAAPGPVRTAPAAPDAVTAFLADGSSATRTRSRTRPRTRSLAEPTAPRTAARVRAVAPRAEGLGDARLAAHRPPFGPAGDKARRVEAADGEARARFGAAAAQPAAGLGVA
ncbi:hypothetical protein AF335_32145 [Streptomyces eurocidicus]|uniref:Uncharacterized protein n=1 Tax=Streptomyces eurocidicus TaxID=66423 RepID=A0A2N8NMK3_STREU|nr:hypothetical protein [Streptomyces eurocidicus]MBB5120716.1 hypothetical protein [Streptomyces eurocidicus]MBF6050363.1 hypothetical protein [Streptomyces eurocidicus]PNE29999.1 hypothetical protein AF335_32145 [Streptomyces eurocidicus]